MPQGARIYNLFPLLAGKVSAWEEHLDRIAGMGFNWIFLNPIHYPGLLRQPLCRQGLLRAESDVCREGRLRRKDRSDFLKAADRAAFRL